MANGVLERQRMLKNWLRVTNAPRNSNPLEVGNVCSNPKIKKLYASLSAELISEKSCVELYLRVLTPGYSLIWLCLLLNQALRQVIITLLNTQEVNTAWPLVKLIRLPAVASLVVGLFNNPTGNIHNLNGPSIQ